MNLYHKVYEDKRRWKGFLIGLFTPFRSSFLWEYSLVAIFCSEKVTDEGVKMKQSSDTLQLTISYLYKIFRPRITVAHTCVCYDFGTVLVPTASKEWPRTNVVFSKFTTHEQPLPWKLRLQIVLLSVREVVKNGYFTVRLTVREGWGSAPSVLTVSKCENFDPFFFQIWNCILWYSKHILYHCERSQKGIFHAQPRAAKHGQKGHASNFRSKGVCSPIYSHHFTFYGPSQYLSSFLS